MPAIRDADLTSTGLVNGRWEFSGTVLSGERGPPLQGRISYVVVSAARYDRVFEMLRDGSFVRMGGDTCSKT